MKPKYPKLSESLRKQILLLLDGTDYALEEIEPQQDFSDDGTLVQVWKVWEVRNRLAAGRLMFVWNLSVPMDEMNIYYNTIYNADYEELRSIFQYFPRINKDRS